jgi:hypothetical protein
VRVRLLEAIGSGDVVMVTRLDRLARSTRDLLNLLDTLAKRGAGFRSLADTWADTTTPHGHLFDKRSSLGDQIQPRCKRVQFRGADLKSGDKSPAARSAHRHDERRSRGLHQWLRAGAIERSGKCPVAK